MTETASSEIPTTQDLVKAHDSCPLRACHVSQGSQGQQVLDDIISRRVQSDFNLPFRDEQMNAIARINMPYGRGVRMVPPG
ncbi:hypothetical protein Hypma_000368 [Hypsizygus marmoreus]|uniref:Uncharacterized protein n=1 Tax=Hypsizygus marmoreus TaxID=39966 RepID=A0A369J8D2_HYPMA|nr:hypothetical protein Hypma_000368 [Hypsizygus marmoreus]